DADLDLIVATGLFVPAFEPLAAALGDRLVLAPDPVDAAAPLLDRLTGGEVVLLKGSRGVALERLLPPLEERFGEPGAGSVRDGGPGPTGDDGADGADGADGGAPGKGG
ncbi:MAG: hypothetical protein ACOCUW_03180, partial [Gemmatimonadota bacterium]